jgi:hypothetical protein
MIEETNEITIHEAQPVTPMALIDRAMQSNASIEKLQQLFDLQIRFEENEAKKAYFKAVAAFKSETITILKTKHVKFTTQKGVTEYNHEELGTVVKTVIPFLGKHGLSHKWIIDQPDGKVKITCILSHELGYSESTAIEGPRDDSGGKNFIQSIKSTVSYLERITFLAITGLAAEEQDDDGRTSEAPTEPLIDDEQLANLDALILETGADVGKFLVYMKVRQITDIPSKAYPLAVKALEAKRKQS